MNTLFSALVTPFSTSGEVNYEALRQITERAIKLTAGGVYVCGSTGEGFLLSPKERRCVVEAVVEQVRGRADVIVNISHMEIRQLFELADHAAEVGATAVSTLPPIFNNISAAELQNYFEAILNRVRLPLTLYNFPQQTHRPLDARTVEPIAKHHNFIGIKHTSEDTSMLLTFKQMAGGRLTVWSGRDAYYLGCLAMGADGAISSSTQLQGDIFVALTEASMSGNQRRAQQLQLRINEIQSRLVVHGAIQSIKRCLTLLGFEAGECRLPFAPLHETADPLLREAIAMIDRARHDFELNRN